MKKRRRVIFCILAVLVWLCGCAVQNKKTFDGPAKRTWEGMQIDHRVPLSYAKQFSVDIYEDGYVLADITDSGRYLLVPEGMDVPEGLDPDIVTIKGPLDHIYLTATSAMDLFRALDGIGNIRLSGTDADGWHIQDAKKAMESGEMLYAGKYNAPDYERILEEKCDLAIESTMIYHNPEVKEELESLGIPVLVERSSYESDPLGRMEWIKLYGALLGKEAEAGRIFDEQISKLTDVLDQEPTGKTVAFFAVTSNGSITVRKSGDYVSKMIELAGGEYIFDDLGGEDNALSTVNIDMEAFFAGAKDADYLIYNSTIEGEMESLDELLAKCPVLEEFRAVKNQNVWCTRENLFQESMGIGNMILDMHRMMSEDISENGSADKKTGGITAAPEPAAGSESATAPGPVVDYTYLYPLQ